MNLWLSGPTGAGKTTIAAILAAMGCEVVREQLPTDLFEAFRRDPAAHCAALQEAIMRSRRSQWKDASQRVSVVFDRSIAEDIDIFCQLHHERGLIGSAEYERLRSIAEELQRGMRPPDLIVYLSTRVEVLRERILAAGHPKLIVDGLDRQTALYERWVSRRRESVIRIDNSDCAADVLADFLRGQSSCG